MLHGAPSADSRLHYAAVHGDTGKIKRLLTAGEDINGRDQEGRTPLLCSVYANQTNSVRVLLAAGANPSIPDNENYAPLFISAGKGSIAVAKMLLQTSKIDVNALFGLEDAERTALVYASRHGHKEMVKLLIESGCDVSKVGKEECSALSAAARGGHSHIIEILADAGADVNAPGFHGLTALMVAAEVGCCEAVVKLLEKGANARQQKLGGTTAFHYASHFGFDDVLKALIKYDGDLNQGGDKQFTPLHIVSNMGHTNCARTLICAGANISALNFQSLTPLHFAALSAHVDVIELLLSSGADVRIEDDEGSSPLAIASIQSNVQLRTCIDDAGALRDTKAVLGEYKLPTSTARAKVVDLLIDAGSDPNRCDHQGRNSLFRATDLEVVKALLSRGASAKHIDIHGRTVLHYAGVLGASAAVICTLYKSGGADPTIEDANGYTAAASALEHGQTDAATLLNMLATKHRALNG